MKKILKTVIFLGLAALLVAGAVRAVKHKKAEEAAIPPAKEYAVVVRTTVPRLASATLTLPALALVANDNDVVLASKLAARVSVMHRSGAKVKQGDVVLRMDKRDLDAKVAAIKAQISGAKSELAAAETALKTLEAKHARTEKLMKVRGASQEEYDAEVSRIAETKAKMAAAEAKIESLAASLREVAQLLDYAVLTAPVSGTVAETFVNPGDMAMPGKPLMKIAAKAGNYLKVRLPADVNATAIVYKGRKLALYPLHTTFNGLDEYRTRLLNDGTPTGTRVDVAAVLYAGEGVRLPSDALLDRGGEKFAFVVEKGRARAVPVTPVASGEEGIVVKESGLAGKPVVVAKPDILLKLLGGVPVKVLDGANRGTEVGNREGA
ncbi:efflux RND transporter periplasmic adaptor subunit [Hydrogenimonas sp.]